MVASQPADDHYTKCVKAAYDALTPEQKAAKTAVVLLVVEGDTLTVRTTLPLEMIPPEYAATRQDKIEALSTMTGHLLLSAAILSLGIPEVEAGLQAAKEGR